MKIQGCIMLVLDKNMGFKTGQGKYLYPAFGVHFHGCALITKQIHGIMPYICTWGALHYRLLAVTSV